jgi:two-component system, chemotaxis family, protein-glutamate methylesterase/glutaminase
MPQNALKTKAVDYTLTLSQIAQLIQSLDSQPRHQNKLPKEHWDLLNIEAQMNATETLNFEDEISRIGCPSKYSCPACHGVLWKINDSRIIRYRCRVGHAFSEEYLEMNLNKSVEQNLWMTLRVLEEKLHFIKNSSVKREDLQEELANIKKGIDCIKYLLELPSILIHK